MILMITGANGQVGKSFQKISASFPSYIFHFYDSSQLDITNKENVLETVDNLCPDYIINCAAYTAVDKAESEKETTYLINDTAVSHLCNAALNVGATLVHYSSDYVYHNRVENPLKETDPTSPKGIYAQSKLAGELTIKASGCRAIIIRTSWVYSEFGNNFVRTMLRLGNERDTLSVVNDQIGCPTYATDIATSTMAMIDQYPYNIESQITVNYTNDGQLSWYEFAEAIFKLSNISIELKPIPSSHYPTPAQRPAWSVLDMTLLKELFDLKPIPWELSLKKALSILKTN